MNAFSIEEFRVQIGDKGKVRAEWFYQGRMRQSDYGQLEVDELRRRTIEILTDLLRRNQLLKIDELRLLGDHLFVALFGSETQTYANGGSGPGALLRRAINEHPQIAEDETPHRLVRVRLEIGPGYDHLASWPWEYLHVPLDPQDPNSNFFLGESTDLMLTRQLPLAAMPRTIRVWPPLRVLFVVLSPEGLDDIQYEGILETLLKLRKGVGSPRINLRVLSERHLPDGRPDRPDDDVERAVRTTYDLFRYTVEQFNPHVIHIISHGRYVDTLDSGPCGQLAFPGRDAKPIWIPDTELASYLRWSPDLRLVFVQACESAATSSNPYYAISGMAQSLAQRNIPAVVAMHFQIESAVANRFARTFYESLMRYTPIEVAMHEARRHVYFGGVVGESQRRDFGLPVLYLRDSSPLLMAHAQHTPAISASSVGAPRSGDLTMYSEDRFESHQVPGEGRR